MASVREVTCYRCGGKGHRANVCASSPQTGRLRLGGQGQKSAQKAPLPRGHGGPPSLPQGQHPVAIDRPHVQGRVFALTAVEAEHGDDTIQGILSLYGVDVRVLFDTGSTHSFISPLVVYHIPTPRIPLSYYLVVSMLGGKVLIGGEIYKDCEIMVDEQIVLGDLVALDIEDFDVILGMDWLTRHYAKVDCRRKVIQFEPP
ncbi:uncharacterized protein LOC127808566 [Diospyros lotus]|uniref:uncharacterized protein LOC127808566 n=1 Tax=Diospyros lotus TaxID=55363 RepID=UPI00224E7AE2|nr:uncharacterized protein LOC127808566 [Diospyros lotus]